MNAKNSLLLLVLCAALGGAPVGTGHAQDEPTTKEAAQTEPLIEILIGKIYLTLQDGKLKGNAVVTGPTGLKFKKATITSEGEDAKKFTAYLTIDEFSSEKVGSFIVRVGNKYVDPDSYGGSSVDKLWSVTLRNIDQESAEILNGGPLSGAPKENFRVEYTPYQKTYAPDGPVQIGLNLTNVGKIPLTIFWGTHGGGNYRCRDTQLAFTATLDGAPVPANPKPLPPGFIASPYISKPDNTLKRTVDLSEWLQFSKPGDYVVEATYTLEITNSQAGAAPASWKVDYHDRFSVRVEK